MQLTQIKPEALVTLCQLPLIKSAAIGVANPKYHEFEGIFGLSITDHNQHYQEYHAPMQLEVFLNSCFGDPGSPNKAARIVLGIIFDNGKMNVTKETFDKLIKIIIDEHEDQAKNYNKIKMTVPEWRIIKELKRIINY